MITNYLETIKSYYIVSEFVNMSDESIDEISRLLFVSFSDSSQVEISDMIRLWSLELQWMGPDDAKVAIDNLSESGWLINENNLLKISEIKKLTENCPFEGWEKRKMSLASCVSSDGQQ